MAVDGDASITDHSAMIAWLDEQRRILRGAPVHQDPIVAEDPAVDEVEQTDCVIVICER